MSSRRSRSGGTWISIVLRRKSRSCRKRPVATSCRTSAFVAERTRTSARRVRDEPTRSNSPVSSTRSSFGWRFERHVRDLVEEERAAVRHLEAADAVGLGVGEGALHVAEELALEDALGEPAGVHGQERLRRAGGDGVQRGGDRALAGAVLAGDEHVRVGGADPLDHLQHGPHRRGLGDQQRPALVAQRPVLGLEPLRRGAAPATARPACAGWRRAARSPTASARSRAPRGASPRPRASTLPHAVITTTGSVASIAWSLREQVHPLAARGRVARVVEVDEDDVESRATRRRRARRPASRRSRAGSPPA